MITAWLNRSYTHGTLKYRDTHYTLVKRTAGKMMMHCATAYRLLRLGKPCPMGDMLWNALAIAGGGLGTQL